METERWPIFPVSSLLPIPSPNTQTMDWKQRCLLQEGWPETPWQRAAGWRSSQPRPHTVGPCSQTWSPAPREGPTGLTSINPWPRPGPWYLMSLGKSHAWAQTCFRRPCSQLPSWPAQEGCESQRIPRSSAVWPGSVRGPESRSP